jgi:hypothetical protein
MPFTADRGRVRLTLEEANMANKLWAIATGSRTESWMAAAALLLFPLVMMQVSPEWDWRVAAIADSVIGAALLLIERTARNSDLAFRTGVTTALAASFLLSWVNLVAGITGNPDNAANVGYFVLVLTAGVSAFAARARPDGMARAMLGVGVVQATLTALTATAPSTADDPRGVAGVLLLSGYFTLLWLVSAAAFRRAARHADAAQAMG